MRTFDHIPVKTVRFWAWFDSSVTWSLAIPPFSKYFVASLYWMNGLIGGTPTPPVFEPMHILFVSLTGSLISVWVLVRLLYAAPWMATVDGWGRLWIGATILYIAAVMSAPPILYLFVFTEWIGAFFQLRAAYFSKPTRGSMSIASP